MDFNNENLRRGGWAEADCQRFEVQCTSHPEPERLDAPRPPKVSSSTSPLDVPLAPVAPCRGHRPSPPSEQASWIQSTVCSATRPRQGTVSSQHLSTEPPPSAACAVNDADDFKTAADARGMEHGDSCDRPKKSSRRPSFLLLAWNGLLSVSRLLCPRRSNTRIMQIHPQNVCDTQGECTADEGSNQVYANEQHVVSQSFGGGHLTTEEHVSSNDQLSHEFYHAATVSGQCLEAAAAVIGGPTARPEGASTPPTGDAHEPAQDGTSPGQMPKPRDNAPTPHELNVDANLEEVEAAVNLHDQERLCPNAVPEDASPASSTQPKPGTDRTEQVDAATANLEHTVDMIMWHLRNATPPNERNKVFLEQCRAWHPDKNAVDSQKATVAFQRLQSTRVWFLAKDEDLDAIFGQG